MTGRVTTVVLADDHAVVRAGLRALLTAEPDLRVAGEAADGLAAVKLVERLRPDVLVVDVMMPGINGLEVTRQVGQRVPHTRVVVLSMHASEPYVLEALRHGAAGYVLKDAGTDELIRAVREVAAGRRYLSAPLAERAVAAYIDRAQATPLTPFETLTTREREIFQLAAESHTNADIAARLSLSPRTVEMHRGNMMRKLGLESPTDLIRCALQYGIIAVDPALPRSD
ncbi:MAG: Two-component transcriptional response regulator, LuxR family [uncultured Chloroflexi bacterium]|uniref:Two-component transcriptional response regulator, LuxR family n=1 Tax=uncultured Chloroflexota bacterium TaxID=166587 RepID=A0A6J4IRI9_9CHLR|nr:MAG: Two-component transcriptional response regulator, LuxR family [uncultured Chloroflexota bacterium]